MPGIKLRSRALGVVGDVYNRGLQLAYGRGEVLEILFGRLTARVRPRSRRESRCSGD